MKITIGGPPGSGTTTISKMVMGKFCLEHIYAGKIFRDMAAKRGLTLEEFSAAAEKDDNFDRSVDRLQKEMAKDGTITEGRLAAFMVEKPDLKIWLDAPLDVRVARIAKRESLSPQKVKSMTVKRQQSETERYKKYYGIDIYDLSFYDLVINTDKWDADDVFAIVESAITPLVRATQEIKK
ncbi:MAG: (d)CMP kinase [Candidatus Methanofastidiosia archaeon]